MTGYSREELLNRSISDFESIDSPMETAKRFEEIMKTGSDLFQSRHKRKDGQVIDIEVSANFMDSRGADSLPSSVIPRIARRRRMS